VTYSVRNIAIAIVMAIAAAAAVLVYTSSYKSSLTRGQKRVEVMVASRDIPTGTKAEDAASAMTLTSVLVDDRAPGSITTAAGLQGKVASQTIFAGQQVVASVFTNGLTSSNKSLLLTKTERAIRVVCNPNPSCLIGDVQPGDKVDVYETIKVKDQGANSGGNDVITRLLLSSVRVIDVPPPDVKKGGLSGGAGSKDDPTVMIALSQQLATKFAWLNGIRGQADGQVWFAIRPPDASAEEQPFVIETTTSMLVDGIGLDQVRKLMTQVTGKNIQSGGN
jgi:Flp pilus assembly protein CpaB